MPENESNLIPKPDGLVDVVLDTDAYNEIDDQFALSYLVRNGSKLHVKAVFAAPFLNHRSSSPKEGMERSFDEILKLLTLLDREDLKESVFHGSDRFLQDEETPVPSEAAKRLIELSKGYSKEHPLYVIAIAAVTDVASALLLDPGIIDRIAVVWLGCHSIDWPDNREFNCRQDVAAARVVLGSGVRMVLLPCQGVVSHFASTEFELRHWLSGKNALCDYLLDAALSYAKERRKSTCWSKQIWDVAAVGWLLDPEFMKDRVIPAPIPEYEHVWRLDPARHAIRYVYWVNRDALMEDLFRKLTGEEG